jgi:heme exporter protein A
MSATHVAPHAGLPPLVVEKVTKAFGRRRALVDVSLTCAAREITAILGPNGAGKSTLVAMLATLSSPTSGSIRWGTEDLLRGVNARARIGWVGHEPGLYGDLPALDNLLIFGSLYGLRDLDRRAVELLARVGLADVPRQAPVRTFSRGMLQRLSLARALLHDPELVLFDEPSAALDPAGTTWLAGQLALERNAGKVVILVTHDLDLAAATANHLVILRRGRVARDERREPLSAEPLFPAEQVRSLYQEAAGG